MSVEDVVLRLFEIGAVKFGSFTLKSGIESPIYIDLRLIVSYPKLLKQIAHLFYLKIKDLKFSNICGVPYTALPIATQISTQNNVPMLMRRKEVKTYGTKKCIEGVFKENDICLIIEDLITSGTSILETAEALTNVKLTVRDSVVLIDREQGGVNNLKNNNINLHSVTNITTMLKILSNKNLIDDKLISKVKEFLKNNQQVKVVKKNLKSKRLTFNERLKLCNNPISKKLFEIMLKKETCLCVAADLNKCLDILNLADKIDKLKELSVKHNFLIFEDRKFADIGNTVKQQFGGGMYKISSWSHIINCHSIPGEGIIEGLKQVSVESNIFNNNLNNFDIKEKENDSNTSNSNSPNKNNSNNKSNTCGHGLLLLAEMSSKGNLATNEYTKKTVEFAKKHKDFVIGFISMRNVCPDVATFINMTPGVHLKVKNDNIGQQYKTPDIVINKNGSDIIIVGRGIHKSNDPVNSAKEYKEQSWQAYLDAIKN